MRGILCFVRQRYMNSIRATNARNFDVVSESPIISTNLEHQTRWLSSSKDPDKFPSKQKGNQAQQHPPNNKTIGAFNNNNNNNNNNSKKTLSQTFKKMTDAMREKKSALRSGIGGDRVSSDRVKHDRSSKRFTLDLGNNKLARIDYRTIGDHPNERDKKIEMYHSEVPEELRGRGLGKALAKGALELAARENMRVKLTCTYLIDFVDKSNDPELKKSLINPSSSSSSPKKTNKR